MLNSYSSNTTATAKTSAVSGKIEKTHKRSFFRACHQNSGMAKSIFDSEDEVILQIMCLHEQWILFELVNRKYFEEE